MASDGNRGGAEPPSLTRKEFEQVWRTNKSPKSPLIRELVRRYNDEILGHHPISQVQLWRLEKLEAHAAWQRKHGSMLLYWDDYEQETYETLLVAALKLVHRARWRKAISAEQSDTILSAAVDVLGPAAACPSYVQKMPALPDKKDRPNSRESLAATLGMLNILGDIRPDLRDKFMARDRAASDRRPAR